MDRTRGASRRTQVTTQRLVDGAVVLTCLLLTAFAVKTPWSPLPTGVVAVAGVLGSAAQWPRRRWPHVSAVAGAAGFALSGNPGPWAVGLYAAATYAPRRHLWGPALAGWAGFVGWSTVDAGRLSIADTAYAALGVGLVIAVSSYLATREALLAALRAQAERAETERVLREEQARADERTRIAREMHDVLGHKVSLIALYAGALELHATGDARLREGTALIRLTAREALQELRDVISLLRDEPDAPARAVESFADLEELVQASAPTGYPVELHDGVGPLPRATARVVYRIVQEGMTNAYRHARGAPTTVTVGRTDDGRVTVTVRNEPGADTSVDLPGTGTGLIGLAERIRLVGGDLRSGPLTGEGTGGWELHAVVPWLDPPVEERRTEVPAP